MPVLRPPDESPPNGRPSIQLLTDDPGCPVLLKCGRSAVLSVHVIGHFKPSVRWFIGQRMVRDCPRYGLSTDGHDLYALVIKQVTEELECGVLVTVSSNNGVSSKLIDIKTYRVLSRMDHKSDVRTTGSNGAVRRRRQGRGQLMSYPVRGRHSLGSLCALRPGSIQGLTLKKAYSSTDAILKEGHVTPDFADSSSFPDKRKPNCTIRMRSSVRAVEIRRLKKAFSWVENLVQELPTPPVTPGVWEGGRPLYLSQDCLLTPSTPVRVHSPATGHSVDRSTSARNRSSTEVEDLENEVLWQMYGFKLGRERPLPGLEEQSEELPMDPHPSEKQKASPENARLSKKTNLQLNFVARGPGPLSTASREKLSPEEETRSALELELMSQGSKARGNKQPPDQRYFYLRTNARTVCCEKPVIADKSNDSEKRFPLSQALYAIPYKLKPETKGNQFIVTRSSEDVNYPIPGSLRVKTFNRTQSPHIVDAKKPSYAAGLAETIEGDHWNRMHSEKHRLEEQSRHATAKSCDDCYVGQPSRTSDHEQEKNKQQHQQQQHSASHKRKVYRATVNLRKKNAGSSGEDDRITKFILVDIDFDNRSVKPADSESQPARDTSSFGIDWNNVERGRTRERGDVQQDEVRRLAARSRSADCSISYLYDKMYRNEHLRNGKQITEILVDPISTR